jgi:glycogen operon protein
MLSGGDEIGRTQAGNNNAYCQDNELSWFDWTLRRDQRELLDFVRSVVALRREHPVLRRRQFFFGRHIRGSEVKDLAWFRPDGQEMTDADWGHGFTRTFGLRLAGDAITEVDPDGARIVDDTLMILVNAFHEPIDFVLPAHQRGVRWEVLLDTRSASGQRRHRALRGGQPYDLEARSLAVFRLARSEPPTSRSPGRASST